MYKFRSVVRKSNLEGGFRNPFGPITLLRCTSYDQSPRPQKSQGSLLGQVPTPQLVPQTCIDEHWRALLPNVLEREHHAEHDDDVVVKYPSTNAETPRYSIPPSEDYQRCIFENAGTDLHFSQDDRIHPVARIDQIDSASD